MDNKQQQLQSALLKIKGNKRTHDVARNIIKEIGQGQGQNMFAQVSGVYKHANEFINSASRAAKNQAFMNKQKLLETQSKYGISGGVASAQQHEFDLKAQASISDSQNRAALQWFNSVRGSIGGFEMLQDSKTGTLFKSINKSIMNDEWADGSLDHMQQALGDDYTDWDQLKEYVTGMNDMGLEERKEVARNNYEGMGAVNTLIDQPKPVPAK